MRHNHFVFQVMTGFDRDEIVFSSKDILTLIILIKTAAWGSPSIELALNQ